MTSCCWLVVMDSERFASPVMGSFCGGLNAYCMHIRPLFLRTSGSSGVLEALLLEGMDNYPVTQKKKKKIWQLKIIGSFKTSSTGMASILSKRGPVSGLCLDCLMDACESLMTSCRHVIPKANTQVLDCLLACDEADARQGAD